MGWRWKTTVWTPWVDQDTRRRVVHPRDAPEAVRLADHEIYRGLDAGALADLERLLVRKRFARGDYIVRAGETAQAMYLLLAGQASVVVALLTGQLKRLATLAPGMAFGELAIVSRSARSADIRADGAAECLALSADTFEELGSHPVIKLTLLENMLRQAYDTVSRLNLKTTFEGS